jgi:hypothetical protein
MAVTADAAPEKKGKPNYVDPVVRDFYASVIEALEDGPDGPSAATFITGEFHRYRTAAQQREGSLARDVIRLSADDAAKAAMLAHASRSHGRLVDENLRMVGQLHSHQAAEGRMHDLAGHLDETHPAIAEQIREILSGISSAVPPAHGPVVIASAVDTRWSVGWFRRTDRPEPGPLMPVPFAGWMLMALDPHSHQQAVESAFLVGGAWLSRSEMADRGMLLQRID